MPLPLQLTTLRYFKILFTCQIQVASVYALFFLVWVWVFFSLGRETIDQGGKCHLSPIMIEMT